MFAGNWCTSVPSLVRHAQRCSCDATLFGDNGRVSPDLLVTKCAPLIKYKSQEQYIVPLYLTAILRLRIIGSKTHLKVTAARMESATPDERLDSGFKLELNYFTIQSKAAT